MNRKKNLATFESMTFVFKQTLHNDKKIFFYSLLTIPLNVLGRLVDVYLVALIVDAAMNGAEKRLLQIILFFALYKLVSELILRYSEWQLSTRNYRSKMKFISNFASKYMRIDFSIIESTKGKDMAQRAKNAMNSVDYRDKSSVEIFFIQCATLIGNVCGLFVYAGIITILNPLIIVMLLVTSGVSYILQLTLVKYDQRDKIRYIPLDRRLWYIIKELRDLNSAKDIRLYGLMGWMRKLFEDNLAARMKLHAKRSRYQYLFLVLVNITNTIFTGYIYYYLISSYLTGKIDISQFILYFGLITGFNSWLVSVIDGFEDLHRTLLNIDDLRCFHSISEHRKADTGIVKSSSKNCIQFENVFFGYKSGEYVISNMNFSITQGEKIAVVGLNGAGKTTLVKLLCGLYTPQSGHILIGGQDIQTFNNEELDRKFAVVFQDIYILPTTVERNITLSDKTESQKLRNVLELSGLKEKIDILPCKEQTTLVKSVLDNATELSGGELQKLALARALYKGGEIFILDEPTSKLDPIAENEMYQKYNSLTNGKTSIFISHRLSSTRFCDRIFYLENGVITECGTHDDLIKLGGAYAHMFETQSRYYKKNTEVCI